MVSGFINYGVQLRLELLVCGRSISKNVITNKFVGLKCLTETKIQILYGHVDYRRFCIVEMGCQMVQLLSAYIVGPTMFVNLTQPKDVIRLLDSNEQNLSDNSLVSYEIL